MVANRNGTICMDIFYSLRYFEDISAYQIPIKPRNSYWNEKNFNKDVLGLQIDTPEY